LKNDTAKVINKIIPNLELPAVAGHLSGDGYRDPSRVRIMRTQQLYRRTSINISVEVGYFQSLGGLAGFY
jgi:hypothetical protein